MRATPLAVLAHDRRALAEIDLSLFSWRDFHVPKR